MTSQPTYGAAGRHHGPSQGLSKVTVEYEVQSGVSIDGRDYTGSGVQLADEGKAVHPHSIIIDVNHNVTGDCHVRVG
jgi:hypothetical protein